MIKYVALMVAIAATVLVVEEAQARHRRGCPGGVCYAGPVYYGGCPGGVCGVPAGPAYYPAAPMKAAVAPSAPAVVSAEAPPRVVAPVIAQPQVRYYYTNTGRLGWRRLAR